MYGDTAAIRRRASGLREAAQEARNQAAALRTQTGAMLWESHAATVLRGRVTATLSDYERLANEVDEAATALEAHATKVDSVKAAIGKAERAIRGAVEAARSTASRAVEVTEQVASSAVNKLMRVVRSVSGEAADLVEVTMFKVGGMPIAREVVEQARSITVAVPHLPGTGSLDWLDLRDRFSGKGWW